MDRWMYRWIDGWIDRYIDLSIYLSIYLSFFLSFHHPQLFPVVPSSLLIMRKEQVASCQPHLSGSRMIAVCDSWAGFSLYLLVGPFTMFAKKQSWGKFMGWWSVFLSAPEIPSCPTLVDNLSLATAMPSMGIKSDKNSRSWFRSFCPKG